MNKVRYKKKGVNVSYVFEELGVLCGMMGEMLDCAEKGTPEAAALVEVTIRISRLHLEMALVHTCRHYDVDSVAPLTVKKLQRKLAKVQVPTTKPHYLALYATVWRLTRTVEGGLHWEYD